MSHVTRPGVHPPSFLGYPFTSFFSALFFFFVSHLVRSVIASCWTASWTANCCYWPVLVSRNRPECPDVMMRTAGCKEKLLLKTWPLHQPRAIPYLSIYIYIYSVARFSMTLYEKNAKFQIVYIYNTHTTPPRNQ